MELSSHQKLKWNEEKNKWLQEERGLSFEAIVAAIENGYLLDIIDNPQPEYAQQKILVVDLNGYVVLAPFLEDGDDIFLKTAFHHRKLNKKLKGGQSS